MLRKEFETSKGIINSGKSLLDYLQASGLHIIGTSGIEGSQNVIRLQDKSTFNWKSRNGEVRVNFKGYAKEVIERNTHFKAIDNGVGDPTRDFSLLVNNEQDLCEIIAALKLIEGNGMD